MQTAAPARGGRRDRRARPRHPSSDRRHTRAPSCTARRATRGTSSARPAARPVVPLRRSPRRCCRSVPHRTAAARSASPRRTPDSFGAKGTFGRIPKGGGPESSLHERPRLRLAVACATPRAAGTASSARTSATSTRCPIRASATKPRWTSIPKACARRGRPTSASERARTRGRADRARRRRRAGRSRGTDVGRPAGRAQGHVRRVGPLRRTRARGSRCGTTGPTAPRTSHRRSAPACG